MAPCLLQYRPQTPLVRDILYCIIVDVTYGPSGNSQFEITVFKSHYNQL